MSVPTDDHRLVFVGGLHRSGTSLLAKSLGSHREIARMFGTGVIQDEGQFLQDVYPPARFYGGVGRFAFDANAYLTEAGASVDEAVARRIDAAWTPYWDKPQAPLRVEKSPPNMLKMRYLQALFPNASFILLVRHPVAVTVATTAMIRRRGRLGRLRSTRRTLLHWQHANAIALEDAPRVADFRLVRYEDLVADPDAVLSELFGWLGLDRQAIDVDVDPSINDRYLGQWHGSDEWREFPIAARCGYVEPHPG